MFSFNEFLIEMVINNINRSDTLKRIDDQAESLADHLISIYAFDEYYDWDRTIFDILSHISRTLARSKTKICEEDVYDVLYTRWIKGTNIQKIVKSLSSQKGLTVVNVPTEKQLIMVYKKLVSVLYTDETFTRNTIKLILSSNMS
jgi:hypothetical protein